VGWQPITVWRLPFCIHRSDCPERVMALLSERSIDSRPFFYPLSSLPAYEHLQQARQAR